MAQLFDIKKVTVGPRTLKAEVDVAPSAPLLTSDDPTGTQLMIELMPEISAHVCLGDAGPHFGEVVADTELAHLLEHVTVELLARTDIAGDISCGRTIQTGERSFEVELSCPDDVLVTGALSSAVWIMQWAYSGGGDPRPDVDAIASGLVDLVASVSEQPAAEEAPAEGPEPSEDAAQPVEQFDAPAQPDAQAQPEAADPEPEPAAAPEPEPEQTQPQLHFAPEQEPASEPADIDPAPAAESQAGDGWTVYNGPRPKSVR